MSLRTHHAGVLQAEAGEVGHSRPASKALTCGHADSVNLQAILVLLCMLESHE